jgi:mRNA-degrading endonuclease RelE of RelBE toxin-antitoxin system
MTRVEVSKQVAEFVRRQAPEPRRLLRRALKELSTDKGDIKALEGSLDGYCRLRVHGYRVIFCYSGRGKIQSVFAERRSIVYEVFAQALIDRLSGMDE